MIAAFKEGCRWSLAEGLGVEADAMMDVESLGESKWSAG